VDEAINHSKNDEVLALTLEKLKKETNREVVIVLLKILFALFRERTLQQQNCQSKISTIHKKNGSINESICFF
jgi:hypothetical protein